MAKHPLRIGVGGPVGSGKTAPWLELWLRPPASPLHGEVLKASVLTVRGVAVSPDGVARVEVSTDGGVTWHEAEGAESWSRRHHEQRPVRPCRGNEIEPVGKKIEKSSPNPVSEFAKFHVGPPPLVTYHKQGSAWQSGRWRAPTASAQYW